MICLHRWDWQPHVPFVHASVQGGGRGWKRASWVEPPRAASARELDKAGRAKAAAITSKRARHQAPAARLSLHITVYGLQPACLSASRMPSNSSMQHSPPSASTSAPASSVHCDPSWTAAAVRPAADDARPVVVTALVLTLDANFMNWDLPAHEAQPAAGCQAGQAGSPKL